MKDELANEKLMSFFDRGFSRRCFIVFPKIEKEYKAITREDTINNIKIASQYKKDIDKTF
jgi:hypothetical protein